MPEKIPEQRQYRLAETPLHLEMRDALAETIDRATKKRGVPLYLMGGVSASLMAREAWPTEQRPLSRDLDFLIPNTPDVIAALEAEYGGQFKENKGKAVFKSYKLQSHSAGNGVELDFIASSNIVHPDAAVAFTATPLVLEHAGTEEFLGQEVRTLPPELVALQKLFAGRGLDLGKYDLVDAQALIESGRVDPQLFQRFLMDITGKLPEFPNVVTRLRGALARLTPSERVVALTTALSEANLHAATADFRAQIEGKIA